MPTKAPTDNPSVTPGNPTASPTASPTADPSFGHAIFISLAVSDDVPQADYPQIGETLVGVTDDMLMRKVGFDVQMREADEKDDGNRRRRLVVLEHDATSLSLVPMNIPDQRQEDVGFTWVAYRMSYTVSQFDGLGKNEIKEMIDEGWTESIEDGSLLAELQSKDPDIIGASVFGQEVNTEVSKPVDEPVDLPTAPTAAPTKDEVVTGTRGGGGSGGGGTPWWVWLLVGLVGLAIAVALAFFVLAKRRTKNVRREASQKGELMVGGEGEGGDDSEMPTKVPAAPTFEESSDEGHKQNHPNDAFAHDKTINITFPSFEVSVPEDEKGTSADKGGADKGGAEWGGDGFSMNDLAKQPGW